MGAIDAIQAFRTGRISTLGSRSSMGFLGRLWRSSLSPFKFESAGWVGNCSWGPKQHSGSLWQFTKHALEVRYAACDLLSTMSTHYKSLAQLRINSRSITADQYPLREEQVQKAITTKYLFSIWRQDCRQFRGKTATIETRNGGLRQQRNGANGSILAWTWTEHWYGNLLRVRKNSSQSTRRVYRPPAKLTMRWDLLMTLSKGTYNRRITLPQLELTARRAGCARGARDQKIKEKSRRVVDSFTYVCVCVGGGDAIRMKVDRTRVSDQISCAAR